MPALEDVSIFNFSSDDEDDGTVADMNNLDTTIQVSPIPTIGIHKDHPLDQKKDGTFISQDKYTARILKKFGFTKVKTARTPMETQKPLLKDEDGEEVDVHIYQFNPKVSHVHVVKKIFRLGKGFSGKVTPLFQIMVIQNQSKLGEGSAMPTDPHHIPTILQPSSSQPQKIQKPRKPTRKDTQVPQPSGPTEMVADEAVHKELGDSLVRAATTASSLETEQYSRNITKTQSKETPNKSRSQGTNLDGGLRCQETIEDTITQTRVNTFEDFRTELVEGKEKRAGTELEQEITKKQKVDDNNQKTKLKQLMETILDEEEVTIDVIPLVVKKDLEDLYKLVKSRYGSTRPVESMDYLLWSDMKKMFEPHVEDEVWKMQQGYKVLEWKLYGSCRVHSLMMQSMQIYMLVEKKYHLTPPTLLMMHEKKL
nr:hypothetical protein [Tanacetum cinerariifolium]